MLVTLSNPSAERLSLFNFLDLKQSNGAQVLPQLWSDNMLSLTPSSHRIIELALNEEQLKLYKQGELQLSLRSLQSPYPARPIIQNRLLELERQELAPKTQGRPGVSDTTPGTFPFNRSTTPPPQDSQYPPPRGSSKKKGFSPFRSNER